MGTQNTADPARTALELDKLREELREAKAKADKAEREEREAMFTGVLPDLTKVTRGKLEVVKDGQPGAGTPIAGRALASAAGRVAEEMLRDGQGTAEWKLLVTSDADLAASDAAHHAVKSSVKRLTDLAGEVLAATGATSQGDDQTGQQDMTPSALAPAMVPGALKAIATATPGLISLLAQHRTLTTGTYAVDDFAATAAVAGALRGSRAKPTVFHDTVRAVPVDGIYAAVDGLHERREALLRRKVELDARKPVEEGADVPEALAASIALVAAVSASIDELLKALDAVPAGGTRSPLTAAALREGLHDGTFTHVVVVKVHSSSGMQMTDDKLIRDDRYAVVAAATLSWVLIDLADGSVLDGGIAGGTAQIRGRIGDDLSFDR